MNSDFLTPLDLRIVDDSQGRPKYELLAAFGFWSRWTEREYWVPVGFQFDGPSIPQLALWTTGAAPGLRASCIHDWMLVSNTADRATADRVFLEALRVCGVDEGLAQLMYQGVRMYSRSLEEREAPLTPGDLA